ncbi:MAG: hypothetical protein RMK73_09735 [Geminicoccaceae bacterium]|nr:hypothetical protein [Geminicoccaceae bacterium]
MGTDRRVATVILGAGGRDFHVFNLLFRNDPHSEVVAFAAAQIPGLAGRTYPPELAGPLYPRGIPIVAEHALEELARSCPVDRVIFAYSDVSHLEVMHAASRALALGADFLLVGPRASMLSSRRPVVAVTAMRTGCGKSQVARHLARGFADRGQGIAVVRHPMAYGDLLARRVLRFAHPAELDRTDLTLEEREELEPHLEAGDLVFVGVDQAAVLAAAEAEADLLLWDGGNNDFPMIRPDLLVCLADALRPGQAAAFHPGEACLRMADIVVIAKADLVPDARVDAIAAEVRALNPRACLHRAASRLRADRPPEELAGRRVLVLEDGPSLTHGGLPTGAGFAFARAAGARILDPRPFAVPPLDRLWADYPHLGPVLPAVGYDAAQRSALARTIAAADPEVLVVATPVDAARVLGLGRPCVRVRTEHVDLDEPGLLARVEEMLARARPASAAAARS